MRLELEWRRTSFGVLAALGVVLLQTALVGVAPLQAEQARRVIDVDNVAATVGQARELTQRASTEIDEDNTVPGGHAVVEGGHDAGIDRSSFNEFNLEFGTVIPRSPGAIGPGIEEQQLPDNVFVFPATGDTRFTQSGTNFWNQGDFVEGIRTFPGAANAVAITLAITDNSLSCDTQDHAFMIDGVTVGTFSVSSSDAEIDITFGFPQIPAGAHTLRIETTRTVNGGCGSAGFPDDMSTVAFSNLHAQQAFVFPATGDTRFTQSGTNFWNQGDFVEGIRTFSGTVNAVAITLAITENVLSCDTQDHALMLDGVTIGTFIVGPGDTVVTGVFNFPAISPGDHTLRIETTRTVNSGCGSAGFPDNVSTAAFFSVLGFESFVFPATGDTRFIQSGTNFWNQGDFVEGTRSLVGGANQVLMVLRLEDNVLSCDTQDHELMIDGVSVGPFSISAGDTVIRRNYGIPTIGPGNHDLRIETMRTVNSGCGSAGFPNDVSTLTLEETGIFTDGFENGDTSAWSTTVP